MEDVRKLIIELKNIQNSNLREIDKFLSEKYISEREEEELCSKEYNEIVDYIDEEYMDVDTLVKPFEHLNVIVKNAIEKAENCIKNK